MPYDEALEWIQFTYTGDILGAYVDPGATELELITFTEGGPILDPAMQRLQTLYPEDYDRGSTSMVSPLGPE